MRFLLSVAIIFVASTLQGQTDDAIEIKILIPAATGMAKDDFLKLAISDSPKAANVNAKSLTFEIMQIPILPTDTKPMLAEFSYAAGVPKPSELGDEWMRLFSPITTAVHANRITKVTCDVENDHASGTVSFKVPNLYSGKFDYAAQRTGGKWKITEIEMPARKIYLVRDDKGKWTKP